MAIQSATSRLTAAALIVLGASFLTAAHAAGHNPLKGGPIFVNASPATCTLDRVVGYESTNPHLSTAYSLGCPFSYAAVTINLFGNEATAAGPCTYGGPSVASYWGNPVRGTYYGGSGSWCDKWAGAINWSPNPWHP